MFRYVSVFLVLVTCAVQYPLAAEELTVGVLHIERVFEESAAMAEASQTLRVQADEANQTIRRMTDQIKNVEAELDTLPQGTTEHLAVANGLEVLRLQRKLYGEQSQGLLAQSQVDLTKVSYTKIRALLADFCEQRGLTSVLLGSPSSLNANSVQDIYLELATHAILYHAPEIDITDDFLVYVDENFQLDVSVIDAPATEAAVPAP